MPIQNAVFQSNQKFLENSLHFLNPYKLGTQYVKEAIAFPKLYHIVNETISFNPSLSSSPSTPDRLFYLIKGVALMIPVVNVIVHLALKFFRPIEISTLSAKIF